MMQKKDKEMLLTCNFTIYDFMVFVDCIQWLSFLGFNDEES